MFNKFAWLAVVALIAVISSIEPQVACAQSGVDDGEIRLRFDRYEEKINALLKTRRNEEKQFVADVLTQVRAGELPERLIETSYKWVLNNKPGTKYPFVYFERVLRLQADKLGLEIPAFDYEIYGTRVFRN